MSRLKELLDTDLRFAALMKAKSVAILDADALKAQGQVDAAIEKYKDAAAREYQVYEYLTNEGLAAPALHSLVSSASCWFEAGSLEAARKLLRRATELCDGDDRVEQFCLMLLRRIERQLSYSQQG